MNKFNIFVKTRELINSLDLKTRELINSLDLKTRELVNSLVFTKMLVLFIFWLRGIRKFLAIRILVFHLSIYYNDVMAWVWRGGIGKFPPNPEAKKNEFPTSGKAASGEFNFFCRGMRREFSNTFSPYPSY